MRNIGTYIKVVDADEHRIIEELRSLREKKRKDAHDITAAEAKSIRIREGYARANELRNNKPIEEALIPQFVCSGVSLANCDALRLCSSYVMSILTFLFSQTSQFLDDPMLRTLDPGYT